VLDIGTSAYTTGAITIDGPVHVILGRGRATTQDRGSLLYTRKAPNSQERQDSERRTRRAGIRWTFTDLVATAKRGRCKPTIERS
jgi:hypothetical protein